MTTKHVLVVGVDGTAASAAAVRWAVGEAHLRHATVHIVSSWHHDERLRAPYAPAGFEQEEEYEAQARARLDAVVDIARGALPPGDLCVELSDQPPARVLLDRAVGADLLVLGSTVPGRHSTGGYPPPIGPVARACLRNAPCAVVVVTAQDEPVLPL